MKTCGKCKIEKSSDGFSQKKSAKDGLQAECKDCRRLYQKQWYLQNSNKHISNVRRQRKLNAPLIKEWYYSLKNKPCVDCGKSDHPFLMDFDHISDNKQESISNMVQTNRRSKKQILEEIQKCELVCVRCHRIRTWNRAHPNETINQFMPQ